MVAAISWARRLPIQLPIARTKSTAHSLKIRKKIGGGMISAREPRLLPTTALKLALVLPETAPCMWEEERKSGDMKRLFLKIRGVDLWGLHKVRCVWRLRVDGLKSWGERGGRVCRLTMSCHRPICCGCVGVSFCNT